MQHHFPLVVGLPLAIAKSNPSKNFLNSGSTLAGLLQNPGINFQQMPDADW
jgi:hypothetical protein